MNSVLIIEDNSAIQENTMEILQLSGYNVLTADDGGQGISMALLHTPDIILCDIQMPVKSGYEVLIRLKADPLTSKIPFVFFTASVEKKEIQKAMELGADGYIGKPFETSELIETIKIALGKDSQAMTS
jgi:CRP/FNR family cyclic AMP-dependent transcriptional regulator